MKKIFRNIFFITSLFLTGIFAFSGFFSQLGSVSAETIKNKEFVNLVLTGGQGYYPYMYFDKKDLEQSTYSDEGISYYDENGELTNTYRAIIDKITAAFSKQYSTGTVSVQIIGEMNALAETGHYFAYASAGLLALKNNEDSKIIIYFSSNGETVSVTSDLVYTDGQYSPDWVKTDKIYITSTDQIVTFSYSNRGASSIWDKANFLIFEPTISFGLEINEIVTTLTDSTVAQGQLVKLNAETFLSQLNGTGICYLIIKIITKLNGKLLRGQA
jgi:hypothetical protein